MRQTSSQRSAEVLHGLTSPADAIDEDFRPAAGQTNPSPPAFSRSSTSPSDSPETVAMWSISGGLKPWMLICGKSPLDVAEQLFVPLELQLGVHAALQENLVAAQGDRLLDLPVQLVAAR